MLAAHWDRFDIVEAHLVFEADWNSGGWLKERPNNVRRMEATHVQVLRLGFHASPILRAEGFRALSRNGRAIYLNLRRTYGFKPACGSSHMRASS